jgi:hypothetical protein
MSETVLHRRRAARRRPQALVRTLVMSTSGATTGETPADHSQRRTSAHRSGVAAEPESALFLHVHELSVAEAVDGADWLAVAARGGRAG